MTLADKIALMYEGKIIQYDRPDRLYNEPLTEFGGWFLGNPGMNFVPATVADGWITAPILPDPLPAPAHLPQGGSIKIGLRPEWIAMHGEPRPGSVPGMLKDQTVGIAGRYLTKVSFGSVDVKVKTDGRPPAPLGGTVHLAPQRDKIMLYANGNRIVN